MWAPGRCSRRARFGPRESDDVVVATARADRDKRGSGANERPVTPTWRLRGSHPLWVILRVAANGASPRAASRRARGHGSRRSRPRLVDVVTGVRVEVAGFALPEATCGGVAGRVRLPVDAAGREVGSPPPWCGRCQRARCRSMWPSRHALLLRDPAVDQRGDESVDRVSHHQPGGCHRTPVLAQHTGCGDRPDPASRSRQPCRRSCGRWRRPVRSIMRGCTIGIIGMSMSPTTRPWITPMRAQPTTRRCPRP